MREETRTCQNCKSEFKIEPEGFEFYDKIKVPAPTWCPECRMCRRAVFWNEHDLYRKKDARTGELVFSTFPEHSPVKIYEHDYWWSDAWDPMDYGREHDFSRPFFEQFRDLLYSVPLPSREIKTLINSDYSNQSSFLKNCYLCFDCDNCEDCLYGVGYRHSGNSVDCSQGTHLEFCYELFSCAHCYRTFYTTETVNSQDVWFSIDCDNCSNCFGCANLWHKQYHIFNVPYTKEGYHQKIKEFNLGSYKALQEIKGKVRKFWNKFPVRYMHGIHNVNAVGDYIYYAKNIHHCYQGDNIENIRYSQNVTNGAKDCCDYTSWGDKSELVYEAAVCGEHCRNLKFCVSCWPACSSLEYSMNCHSSGNLFGCVGLRKKQYCILNKQYAKDEYEELRAEIIRHMDDMPYINSRSVVYKYGEFFPPEFSPLAYNESIAVSLFPRSRNEAESNGFVWRNPDAGEYQTTAGAGSLPDHINDVGNDVCKEIIQCLACGRAYRIIPTELKFYRQNNLPLPRMCHRCRYHERMKLRNPLKWYNRKCMCDYVKYKNAGSHKYHPQGQCPNQFQTSYAPDRKEIVYCEECYQQEVI